MPDDASTSSRAESRGVASRPTRTPRPSRLRSAALDQPARNDAAHWRPLVPPRRCDLSDRHSRLRRRRTLRCSSMIARTSSVGARLPTVALHSGGNASMGMSMIRTWSDTRRKMSTRSARATRRDGLEVAGCRQRGRGRPAAAMLHAPRHERPGDLAFPASARAGRHHRKSSRGAVRRRRQRAPMAGSCRCREIRLRSALIRRETHSGSARSPAFSETLRSDRTGSGTAALREKVRKPQGHRLPPARQLRTGTVPCASKASTHRETWSRQASAWSIIAEVTPRLAAVDRGEQVLRGMQRHDHCRQLDHARRNPSACGTHEKSDQSARRTPLRARLRSGRRSPGE